MQELGTMIVVNDPDGGYLAWCVCCFGVTTSQHEYEIARQVAQHSAKHLRARIIVPKPQPPAPATSPWRWMWRRIYHEMMLRRVPL